jgi:hypothetical protein
MIKQISLIALVVIGIGALGTILTPAFATLPPGHTGNPGTWGNPGTGNPHQPGGPILITCIVGKGCITRHV